jgi:hypothetical protein
MKKAKPTTKVTDPFWDHPWGNRKGWKNGEIRTVPLCLYNGEMASTLNGKLYAKLWTNWEWVSSWKNTYSEFKGGELCWFLVDLECSILRGHTYFAIRKVHHKIGGQMEPLSDELLQQLTDGT